MTPPDRIAELLDATREAFNTGALIRLKLGGYHGPEADLKAVEIKKIATKAGEKYSFTYKYKTRDTIKNYDEAEALALLRSGLVGEFRSARLATTGFDLMFEDGFFQGVHGPDFVVDASGVADFGGAERGGHVAIFSPALVRTLPPANPLKPFVGTTGDGVMSGIRRPAV